MEAALEESRISESENKCPTSDVISRQNQSIIEADESDSSSDDEEEKEEEEKKKRWSVSSRRSSSRRSSVQHLSARERKALKRLSCILRDGGASRRAQERRDSIALMNQFESVEANRRRHSEKKRRMRSIAKLIDLSMVWSWLERIELEEDSDDSDDDLDLRESASEADKQKRAAADRLDAEAVKVIEGIAATSMAEALGKELGLTYANIFLKGKVQTALRDLTHLQDLKPSVVAYDRATGFYEIRSVISDLAFTSRRSFRDLKRLTRHLRNRGVLPTNLPPLPRPRYVSGARKVWGNVFKGKQRGDRNWEASKVDVVSKWLNAVIARVISQDDTKELQSSKNNKKQQTTFYAGFCCLSPAAEHIEDFLLKFAHVQLRDDAAEL